MRSSTAVTELLHIGPKTEIVTTGDTDLNCVLQHLAMEKLPVHRRPRAALVITDGVIPSVQPELMRKLKQPKVHIEALITPPRHWRLRVSWADHWVAFPRKWAR